ncbi:3-oxoacyl-[acyl-carrier protein] reductase [Nocardia sp. GAS34]|uniref:SDR family oxidoreductase n=1 Tax=unclassified Nocardia TaxID=2637762 RepID=UPI003D25D6F8
MRIRTALVGGGATGIGYASAEALARGGYRVVLAGRREAALKEAAERLRASTTGEIGVQVFDIAGPDAAAVLDAVENRCGAVDVLVLNAGGPPPGSILEVADAQWREAADLLLLGPLRLARTVLPRMADRGFGRLVFVTSAVVRQPQPDLAISVVLRSAVTAAAKLLSREFAAAGVTVNCVAPGATATERRTGILRSRAATGELGYEELDMADAATIPARRIADPGEIAAAVAFLASAAAGYVNGTVVTVDGGRTETI